MKFKPWQKDDYVIAGYSEEVSIGGDIKVGILGRVVCMSDPGLPILGYVSPFVKPPDGYFGVGSGFTMQQRIDLWKDKESLLGKRLKVKYQTLTKDRIPFHGVVAK
jgi:ATP-dependent DNA ligase